MFHFTDKQFDEIAQELDCGNRAYYHRETGELLFIPEDIDLIEPDENAWEVEQEKLESNPGSYNEVKKPDSNESFQMMAEFAEGIKSNNRLYERLMNALENKNPFKNFRYELTIPANTVSNGLLSKPTCKWKG